MMGDFAFRGDGDDQVVAFRREKGKDEERLTTVLEHVDNRVARSQPLIDGFKARMVRISRFVNTAEVCHVR